MDRYSRAWVDGLFDDLSTAARWLKVTGAVITVCSREGLIPADASALDLPPADDELVAAWRAREAVVGHDVAAFLDVVRDRTLEPTRNWVHFGLTSSNLVDTAQVLALRTAGSMLAGQALEAGRALIHETPDIDRVSRTHGQRAEPSSIRTQAAVWGHRLTRSAGHLADATNGLRGSLAGPTGQYETIPGEVAAMVALRLGVDLEFSTDQAVARDRLARWGRAVADVATACAHFATQVRLGARDGELREPTGVSAYKGSSSMPWKRNPTRSERICGLERVVRALTSALDADVVWWDQRDLSASSVERVVLPQLVSLTDFILVETRAIIDGLEVDEEACARGVAGVRSGRAVWDAVATGSSHEEAYEAARGPAPALEAVGALHCRHCGSVVEWLQPSEDGGHWAHWPPADHDHQADPGFPAPEPRG